MSIEQNLLRSNAYFAALMLKIMKQLILLNGLVLKKMYQFIPRPSPLPPGAGERRFLPLSPSLRGIKGEGRGLVVVLNCYDIFDKCLLNRIIPGTTKGMTPQYTPYSQANTPQYALFFYCIDHILRTGGIITAGRVYERRNNELIY